MVCVGDVTLVINTVHNLMLKIVRYAPDLKINLRSISELDSRGYTSSFVNGKWKFF